MVKCCKCAGFKCCSVSFLLPGSFCGCAGAFAQKFFKVKSKLKLDRVWNWESWVCFLNLGYVAKQGISLCIPALHSSTFLIFKAPFWSQCSLPWTSLHQQFPVFSPIIFGVKVRHTMNSDPCTEAEGVNLPRSLIATEGLENETFTIKKTWIHLASKIRLDIP